MRVSPRKLKIFENDKKCFAWAKLKVKNQKQSSVNQSNKEANSDKQKGCTQKLAKNNVLKLGFLSLFLV